MIIVLFIINYLPCHLEGHIKSIVIDDEDVICRTLKIILEKEGHETSTTNSGLDAIALMKVTDFKVAFVDLAMPQMNGTELIQWIKKEKPDVKIVAMSGMDWKDTLLQGALNVGADRILKKPFQITDIQKAMSDLIN